MLDLKQFVPKIPSWSFQPSNPRIPSDNRNQHSEMDTTEEKNRENVSSKKFLSRKSQKSPQFWKVLRSSRLFWEELSEIRIHPIENTFPRFLK